MPAPSPTLVLDPSRPDAFADVAFLQAILAAAVQQLGGSMTVPAAAIRQHLSGHASILTVRQQVDGDLSIHQES